MLSCYVNLAAKLRASRVSQDFKFVKYFFIKFKIAETLEALRLKRLSTIHPQKREVIHILSTGFGINPQTLQPCDFQRFFPNRCSVDINRGAAANRAPAKICSLQNPQSLQLQRFPATHRRKFT